jgi:hypothetical protein
VSADADGVLLPLLCQARRVDPLEELARLQPASAAEMRWAAWLHAASGDSAQSERLLLQARLSPDDQGESWFAIGLLRLAREDVHGAREAFVAAARAHFPSGELRRRMHAELRAYDAGENRFAALQILDEAFDNAFRCFVMLQRVRPAEHKAYEASVSLACAWLGHSAATAAILEHDRAINGDSIWYHVNLGHFDWLAGRRDAADRHYRCVREIAIRDKLSPCHFNAGAVIWLTTAESERLLTRPAPRREMPLASDWSDRFGMRCAALTEIVFVVGCDGNYFAFFPKFLLSVVRAYHAGGRGRQTAVHCHMADPKPGQIEFLQWAADWLGSVQPGVKLSFGSSISAHRLGAYYTCLRFLALPAVMDWYETGVLAMDIDSELDPDFFEHLDLIRRHDAGLRMYSFSPQTKRQVGGEPWSIGAHPTYLAYTQVGRRFAAFLAAYIEAAYDATSVANWTIDQCAIARAYDLILRPSIERDTGDATVLNFAYQPSISRLPEAGKLAFLNEDGGVTTDNFAALAEPYLYR